MATFTWPMPSLCSRLALVMSPTSVLTRRISSTIAFIVEPACVTRWLPVSMRVTESSISDLISRAALAERCASVRTSPATTAKTVLFGNWDYMGYRESPDIRFISDPYSVDGLVILKYSFRDAYGVLQSAAIGYGKQA